MKFLQKTGKASSLTFSQNALKITLIGAVGYTCLPCGPAETQKPNSVTQLKPHGKAMGESPKGGDLSLSLGSMSSQCYRLHQDQKEDNLRLWSPSYVFYAVRQVHCLISCECVCVHVLICAYVCMCMLVHIHIYVWMCRSEVNISCLSQSIPMLYFEKEFLIEPGAHPSLQTVQPEAFLTLPLQYSRLGGHAQL